MASVTDTIFEVEVFLYISVCFGGHANMLQHQIPMFAACE